MTVNTLLDFAMISSTLVVAGMLGFNKVLLRTFFKPSLVKPGPDLLRQVRKMEQKQYLRFVGKQGKFHSPVSSDWSWPEGSKEESFTIRARHFEKHSNFLMPI